MTVRVHKRLDLALNQLRTAIMLFVTGRDRFSVITLAGAADVILSELVLREGKENFVDTVSKKEGKSRSRKDVGRDINDEFCINIAKHMDPGDDDYVDIEVEDCAIGAILKALANYNMLDGRDVNLIQGFRYWLSCNVDLNKYNINTKGTGKGDFVINKQES
jgi:hypothetical protein